MPTRRRSIAGLLATAARSWRLLGKFPAISIRRSPRRRRGAQPPPGATIGTGQVKAGLILPLSAPGNAGVAGQSMRNAAEMALAEFNDPNIQLLVKDDGGNAAGRAARRPAGAR